MEARKFLMRVAYKIIYQRHDSAIFERYTFQKKSYGGKEPEKTYMILRRDDLNVGVFSDYLVFLGAIEFAVNRGYIPVIDRLNFPLCILQRREEYYKNNAWEYFFEQPMGIGLEEVKKDRKNVILSPEYTEGNVYDGIFMNKVYQEDMALRTYWKRMAHKYIRFNQDTTKELDAERERLKTQGGGIDFDKERILGIGMREGYAVANKNGAGLPHQFTTDEVIDHIKKIFSKDHQISKIFLTCEYEETINIFEKEFTKEKVFYIPKMRYHEGEEYPYDVNRMADIYDRKDRRAVALNYVKEVYFLSCCDSIIYTMSSGNMAAYLMKPGEYRHVVFCDENGIVHES